MSRRGDHPILFLCALLLAGGALCAQQPPEEPSAPPKNAAVEQLQVVHRYQNDGTGEVVQTARLRILTEVGLKAYGAVYLPYSSQLEDLRIDYLRTVKADGSVIPADPSKAIDITPPVTRFAPMFSDVRMKVLVAPQLQVGDAIEYQYTRTIRVAYMPGNFWVMYSLDRVNPVKAATIVLDVPAGRNLTFEADPCFHYTVGKKDGRKVYRWQIANLEPPTQPGAYRPPLFAASTLSDWKQVGDWYAALQADGDRVTPDVAALAKKLTAGKTTPEQKLDAIYAYVSEKIRYVALEFGIGGYEAHSAQVVLASGYGDCKDKSGLLETLLAAAGIKAYPALVNAVQREIEPTVPMPSQFDHVMTVATLDGKMIWLDSTMQTAPPGVLSPLVVGKQALLIVPAASRLVTAPDAPSSPQENIARVTGSVDTAGTLTLKDVSQVEGMSGVFMRQIFRLQDKDQLAKVVKAMAQFQLAGASASNSSSSDPDDLSGAFKYQYTLTKAGFLDLLQKEEAVPLPILLIGQDQWRRQISEAEEETKNRAKAQTSSGCATNPPGNIKLYGLLNDQETLDVAIPSNYQVELPESIHVDRSFGSYTSAYSFDHGHLEVRRVLNIRAATIPLAEMEALRNFQDLIDADLRQQLTLRRTGSADILSDASSMTADQLTTAGLEALNKHHNPGLARDLLLKAVAKAPKSQYAWNDLGLAYGAIGNFYQAEKAYKKQTEINAYDPYAYNNLGRAETAEQHDEQAIAYYQRQLAVNPLDRDANANLAAAYDRQEDWKDAASAYEKTARLEPGNALVYAAWGTALLRAGKTDEGRQALGRALEIGKQPVVLNNVAYGMAESGVDLVKAEEYARSAVDQTIPGNVASLEVPNNYAATLNALASFLDTLGWSLYNERKLTEADPYLKAAFEIRQDPVVAQHLAMLAMQQNGAREALRDYSYATAQFGGTPPPVPKDLRDYVATHGGVPPMTADRVAEIRKQEQDLNRLNPVDGHSFTWPSAAGAAPAWVALNVLVNEGGGVVDAKVFRGSEPYSSAALGDVRQLHFRPLAWPNHTLTTVRAAFFLYDPSAPDAPGRVMAFVSAGGLSEPTDPSFQTDFDLALSNIAAGFFMVQGHVQAGLDLLRREAADAKNLSEAYRVMVLFARQMKQSGELQAAAAVLRAARPLQPRDDFAWRELAETLRAAGDHAGTIQAYQQLIQLDPEDAAAHYTLGAEYEAQAASGAPSHPAETGKRKPKAGRKSRMNTEDQTQYQPALAQYSLAANLDPENATYRNAYQTLYAKVYHHPPPPAANPPDAPPNP